MTTITLSEWQTAVVELPREVAHRLRSEQGRHLQVHPTELPGLWEVRTSSTVGAFRIGDHRFVIRTKVPVPSVLAMMDVPVGTEALLADAMTTGTVDDLQLAIVRLFCVAVESTTRRGVRRDYVRREERLVAARGRIDMREMIRRPGMDSPIACTYDDHVADIPLNRLLKAALVRCGRLDGVPPGWRRRLAAQVQEMEDVEPLADLEWARRWTPAPMERHYRSSATLARWILEATGMAERHGSGTAGGFTVDMNQLFEDFVTREVAAALPGQTVTGQAHLPLGRDGSVPMRPDIEIRNARGVVAVADCKYKILDGDLARTPDYYQALAYATAYGLDEAWLLYARAPDQTPLRPLAVRNSAVTIRTHAFDLAVPAQQLRRQIRDVAWTLSVDTGAPTRPDSTPVATNARLGEGPFT